MRCGGCGRERQQGNAPCPFCGAPGEPESGVFHTSAVYVSSGKAERLYRSVEELPGDLRSTLEKSTNGANSGTIIIADRNGRREIAKALRHWRVAGRPAAAPRTPEGRMGAARAARIAAAAFLAVIALALIAYAAAALFQWR